MQKYLSVEVHSTAIRHHEFAETAVAVRTCCCPVMVSSVACGTLLANKKLLNITLRPLQKELQKTDPFFNLDRRQAVSVTVVMSKS